MKRIGVVGSRHFFSYSAIASLLDSELPKEGPLEIISGGAQGVDALAKRYASERGLSFDEFHVKDETGSFNQRAHARNQRIVNASDALFAFPCRHSSGTNDTIRRARKLGMIVRIIHVTCEF